MRRKCWPGLSDDGTESGRGQIKDDFESGMIVPPIIPGFRGQKQGDPYKFKADLLYTVSSRQAM